MTIAWVGFPLQQASSLHTLPYYSFALSVGAHTRLHFRVPCCGVVRLSAQDVKRKVAAQGQSAHLRVREEQIKMHTNRGVCDQIQHGVPEVEASGPVVIRGSEDESLKLKPMAHIKNNAVAVKRMGAR